MLMCLIRSVGPYCLLVDDVTQGQRYLTKLEVQYPVGQLVARYKARENEIKLRLQLQAEHPLQGEEDA